MRLRQIGLGGIQVADIHAYESGQFSRRELPCLLAVLRELPPVDIVIVDGYVWLDAGMRPGLGARLYEALNANMAVIGVGKTRFGVAGHACEIRRGKSHRPLFITAAGMTPQVAAEHIRAMHGAYRIPTLLKRVDTLCRSAAAPRSAPDRSYSARIR